MISIVVTAYNGERTLEKTLGSIEQAAAKVEEVEILIIDDGSTDSTAEICNSFVQRNKKIRYIFQENKGVAEARNTGMKNASGDYLWFIDADDEIIPESIKILDEKVKLCEYDVITFGWYDWNDERKEAIRIVDGDLVIDSATKCQEMAAFLVTSGYVESHQPKVSNQFLRGVVWNHLYKRSLIENNELRFFAFWNNEDDWIFNVEVFENAQTLLFIPDCLYSYRIAMNSLSRKKRYVEDMYKKRGDGVAWIYKKIDAICDDKKRAEEYKGILQRKLLLLTLYNETSVEKHMSTTQASKYIAKAVKTEKEKGIYNSIMLQAGIVDKIFLCLLLWRLTFIAYVLNRYIFKRYRC